MSRTMATAGPRPHRAALPSECHKAGPEGRGLRSAHRSGVVCGREHQQRDAVGKCPVDGDFLVYHPAYHADHCYHAEGGQPLAHEGEHSSAKAPQSTEGTVSTGRSSMRERLSNQVINNHRRQRWTPADADGRRFPGQSGLPKRDIANRAIRLYEFLDAD
jgi:hypothetical protein